MKQIQDDIRAFMLKAEQAMPAKPTVPADKILELRAKLIMEEALEQCAALGVSVTYIHESFGNHINLADGNLEFEATHEPSLEEIADGCCDQIYVTVGTAIACGIDLTRIWQYVQASNMAKFGLGSWRRPDGKQMKPENWQPPTEDIRADVLLQQTSTINTSSWMELPADWEVITYDGREANPARLYSKVYAGPKKGRWVFEVLWIGENWHYDPSKAYEKTAITPQSKQSLGEAKAEAMVDPADKPDTHDKP